MTNRTDRGEEHKANARLIAKAPDLKNEIAGVLRVFDRDDVPIRRGTNNGGVNVFVTYVHAERLRALLREIEGGEAKTNV